MYEVACCEITHIMASLAAAAAAAVVVVVVVGGPES